jgi:ribosome biogenesis GTPase
MTVGSEGLHGRVLRTVGGIYEVEIEGEVTECSLRGRLKQEKGIGKVAVGDEVALERMDDGGCVIASVLPRSCRLSRRSADGRREQLIAANVDQLGAVFSVARPEPMFPLLDRFLVLAEANDISAFVVSNKVDLSGEEDAHELFGVYPGIGYDVLYTSAKSGAGIEELRERLAGHITLFVGSSGVGKSSLLNALQPGLGLRVGEISKSLERGRHTTVAAALHPLDVGGYVVDTPGLGNMRLWEMGEQDLAHCFREFEPYLGDCKFDDCSHVHEPQCRILEAVEQGDISALRYASYRKILDESGEESRGW